MGVVGAGQAAPEIEQRRRGAVQRQLLLQLVEGALEERGRGGQHRPPAGPGDARGERHRVLLGDAGIHIVPAGALAERPGDAVRPRGRGGDDHQSRLLGESWLQRGHGQLPVMLARAGGLGGRGIRILPVVRLAAAGGQRLRFRCLVRRRLRQPKALHCVDVHDDRVVDVLHLAERAHQRRDVVAPLHIAVVQPERPEDIRLRRAARRA